jgi:hypothetical protein
MRYSAAAINFTVKPDPNGHVHTYKYTDYEMYKDIWTGENAEFKRELEGGVKVYFVMGMGINQHIYIIPETHPLFNYSFVPDYLLQYREDTVSFYKTIKMIGWNILNK